MVIPRWQFMKRPITRASTFEALASRWGERPRARIRARNCSLRDGDDEGGNGLSFGGVGNVSGDFFEAGHEASARLRIAAIVV